VHASATPLCDVFCGSCGARSSCKILELIKLFARAAYFLCIVGLAINRPARVIVEAPLHFFARFVVVTRSAKVLEQIAQETLLIAPMREDVVDAAAHAHPALCEARNAERLPGKFNRAPVLPRFAFVQLKIGTCSLSSAAVHHAKR